ncbi:MAG: hypothetical protein EKK39_08360 [Sphingobacteriales bacterium]|uniref:hypothetical protein n=1 Tax=Hydrotalea flava TaxID=714549 RepID=UPI000FB98C9A|nr:hypothetical protein [Hydrotalea flava]RTL51225.1 MAG: hypothetical protein EKK39_08360 [Sphingobacteriales bacterium]
MHNRLLNCLLLLCFVLLQNTGVKAVALLHSSKVNHTFFTLQEKSPAFLSVFSSQHSLPPPLAIIQDVIDGDDDTDRDLNPCYSQVSMVHHKMPVPDCSDLPALSVFSPSKSILHSNLLFSYWFTQNSMQAHACWIFFHANLLIYSYQLLKQTFIYAQQFYSATSIYHQPFNGSFTDGGPITGQSNY